MMIPVILFLLGCVLLGWGAGKVQKHLNVEKREGIGGA